MEREDNMPLGTATDKISTSEEKLKEPLASGNGTPTHKPEIAYQRYYDLQGEAAWEWFAGSWHSL